MMQYICWRGFFYWPKSSCFQPIRFRPAISDTSFLSNINIFLWNCSKQMTVWGHVEIHWCVLKMQRLFKVQEPGLFQHNPHCICCIRYSENFDPEWKHCLVSKCYICLWHKFWKWDILICKTIFLLSPHILYVSFREKKLLNSSSSSSKASVWDQIRIHSQIMKGTSYLFQWEWRFIPKTLTPIIKISTA